MWVTTGIVGALVGAIHCTLWNTEYFNHQILLIWRTCGLVQIVTAVLLCALFIFEPFTQFLRKDGGSGLGWMELESSDLPRCTGFLARL